MARRKQTPETSSITRIHTVAYARKQKSGGEGDDEADAKDTGAKPVKPEAKDLQVKDATEGKPALDKDPTAKPQPELTRARVDTIGMPSELVIGAPPEMPTVVAPPELPIMALPEMPTVVERIATSTGAVEDPTHMPGPRAIPTGSPEDPARPPGRVPPGDSRSFRRGNEFALTYRLGNAVISRFGTVGTRGQWRVVEYPTTASASHAYAKESSRFVSEGFSDYRD